MTALLAVIPGRWLYAASPEASAVLKTLLEFEPYFAGASVFSSSCFCSI